MTKTARRWLIGGSIGLVILFAAAFTVAVIIPHDSRVRLESYGKSESVSLDDKEYERMIADKRSFLVMVSQPGCVRTYDMSTWFLEYPEDMQFKYYSMSWAHAKETSLHDYVKYAPSLAVIRDGEVIAWLDADSEEDSKYFGDPEGLKTWLKKYIIF